jgi:hypothetical protein
MRCDNIREAELQRGRELDLAIDALERCLRYFHHNRTDALVEACLAGLMVARAWLELPIARCENCGFEWNGCSEPPMLGRNCYHRNMEDVWQQILKLKLWRRPKEPRADFLTRLTEAVYDATRKHEKGGA